VTRLILWRHGETAWNADDRVQGQTDVDLSEVGRAQAAESAPRIAALRPDLLISSDLKRAAGTAETLVVLTGLRAAYDVRLRERCYGEWQGLTIPEIAVRWPAGFARWRAGEPVGEAGVEDIEQLAKRAGAALQEIVAAAPPDSTIVVATHGGAARHGACALLGWPGSMARSLGGLANCHRTELGFDAVRGWQLLGHNIP
jgi:broad specificity phosphatase PhoE